MNLITGIIKNMRRCSHPLPGLAVLFTLLMLMAGCKQKGGGDDDDGSGATVPVNARVTVNVTTPRIGNISESDNLNATTMFLLNDVVRAPIAGYIRKVNVAPGQYVKQGDVLFSIQSKEAAAIPSADSLFPSKGVIMVRATEAGIVKNVERQTGDYMQDGDSFCTIADNSSLVFILNVPFEMRRYIKQQGVYIVSLPDGETVQARITSQVPEMDRMVQMEKYVLHPSRPLNLPEGLIGTVTIPTISRNNVVILPKSAVLSNETQTKFWVMKVVHDTLAVKTNVEKGLQTKDSVEVEAPLFLAADKILVTGNYGVPDTLRVKIVK